MLWRGQAGQDRPGVGSGDPGDRQAVSLLEPVRPRGWSAARSVRRSGRGHTRGGRGGVAGRVLLVTRRWSGSRRREPASGDPPAVRRWSAVRRSRRRGGGGWSETGSPPLRSAGRSVRQGVRGGRRRARVDVVVDAPAVTRWGGCIPRRAQQPGTRLLVGAAGDGGAGRRPDVGVVGGGGGVCG